MRSHGLVANASPTRLVQILFEHVLSNLATAQGCMNRIQNNLPLNDVVAKCAAIRKTVQIIGHLNGTLDREKGGKVAENLALLYDYMLRRLTLANATNDAGIVVEVAGLMKTVKHGWDQIVREDR
ncbi:MAG TPA: flagellar export chaperone FliS [Steroidobacteraceae bacterium]